MEQGYSISGRDELPIHQNLVHDKKALFLFMSGPNAPRFWADLFLASST